MPLDKPGLESDLEDIFADPDDFAAEDPGEELAIPPASAGDCAYAWAAAVASYASAIVPASTTVSEAETALASSLKSAFESPVAAPAMETAFAAFAGTVGGGMAGFVPTPPPGQVGFAAQFLLPKPSTHEEAAQTIASLIDTWMKTGTATPSGGGSPVNWS